MVAPMFPFRTSSIFRNRWIALLWAAGIIWTAVDYAGKSGGGNDADAPNAAEQAQAAALLNSFGQ